MDVASRRMRAGSILLTLLLGFSLVAADARPAFACSCAEGRSTEEALRSSDAVFFGEVVDIGKLPMEQEGPPDPGLPLLAPVTFDVKESWKGGRRTPRSSTGRGRGQAAAWTSSAGRLTSSSRAARAKRRAARSRQTTAGTPSLPAKRPRATYSARPRRPCRRRGASASQAQGGERDRDSRLRRLP
jgi:hypothetical protein